MTAREQRAVAAVRQLSVAGGSAAIGEVALDATRRQSEDAFALAGRAGLVRYDASARRWWLTEVGAAAARVGVEDDR